MNKRLIFTSLTAIMVAVPAMAEPSHTSQTFPSNGVMEEDYTYVGQANVTNLKVSSGTATTTASYTDCPSGYPNSDDGATSTDQCYTACTVSDFPANSHIASVTGKNYQGANETDTCAIATCETGYTLNPGTPDLTTIIGVTEAGTAYGYIDHSGTYSNGTGSTTQQTYGITAADTFGVDYGSGKGRITGKALCSTQQGDNQYYAWSNPTTSTDVTAAWGTDSNCWCQLDSYTSSSGATQSLSAPWVFFAADAVPGGADGCADYCAYICAYSLQNDVADGLFFRAAVFNAIPAGAPSCQANTIQITWADADAADITANNAGSVTYGGDIRTPRKAVHKAGKVFTGWIFNTPSGN